MSSKDYGPQHRSEQVDDLVHKSCDDRAAPCMQAQCEKIKKMQNANCSCKDSSSLECVPAAASCAVVTTSDCMTHRRPQNCNEEEDMAQAALCCLSYDSSSSPSIYGENHVVSCVNHVPPIKRHACGDSSAPASISSPKSKQPESADEQVELGIRDEDGENAEISPVECVTPRAQQHRIPDPPEACPPPPRKKPRRSTEHMVGSMIGQNITEAASRLDNSRSARQQAAGFSFFAPPPDLHTYPDCIRALFESS